MTVRGRLLLLSLVGNFAGAVLSYLYFRQIDPAASRTPTALGPQEALLSVSCFAMLFGALYLVSRWWWRPLAAVSGVSGVAPAGAAGERARRRALQMPAFMGVMSWIGWTAASVLWGVGLPMLGGASPPLDAVLRVVFGISVVGGSFVASSMFLGAERIWRDELPRYFPNGELSATPGPRLRVRQRLLAVLLLVGGLPLAVLAVAALTRAYTLLGADGPHAAAVVQNLIVVVAVIAGGGIAASIVLAHLLANSISSPLREVQQAMAQVRDGALDVRCAVASNDEIGAVAEGFNAMVAGLRERERIRETFGRYVSPEVRDEILAGRAAEAGALREVTILFADLRDFTPWVEATPAAEVVTDLNAYFGEMDAAIRAHGGLVLQFIGDEIEAVFGAPLDDAQHADAAVAAARAMCERLAAWNLRQQAAGRRQLRHGIGIHSGPVVAGNIGSAQRLSYALVGNTVNVASRIQSLNKVFGTTVLVSAETQALLREPVNLQPMPATPVKGVAHELSVFALR